MISLLLFCIRCLGDRGTAQFDFYLLGFEPALKPCACCSMSCLRGASERDAETPGFSRSEVVRSKISPVEYHPLNLPLKLRIFQLEAGVGSLWCNR